jgi:adenosylmethionine---8-amino-7-oxononanoate aminotransferase
MPERIAELDQRLSWHPPPEHGDRSGSPEAELASTLVELAPPGLRRVLFWESSARAVEAALGLALEYWQRRGGQHRRRTSVVGLRGGRHAGCVDAGSGGSGSRRTGLTGSRWHPIEPGDAGDLEQVLDPYQEEVAAVIIEPLIEAPAAVRVHPPGYLRRVRELCDDYETLLICDETAIGLGRTGTMFACAQERVVPDLICLGEALTGGDSSLGVTMTTDRVYGGLRGAVAGLRGFAAGERSRSAACKAAQANLDRLRDDRTLLRLQPKIRLLRELLEPVATMPGVREIRGRGFVIGIDLDAPDPELAIGRRVVLEARARGVVVRQHDDVVVLTPPLTISKSDLSRLVDAVGESIRAAYAGAGRVQSPARKAA